MCGPISRSSLPQELEASRAIFKRLRRRDLYRQVDFKVFTWEERDHTSLITATGIVALAHRLACSLGGPIPDPQLSGLTEDDVIVDVSRIHYGMQEKSPLDSIRFYSKMKPSVKRPATGGVMSTLTPKYFAEVRLRIFTKHQR